MFYKTLHRKLRINQHEPHKEPEVTLRRFRKVTNSTSDICRVILWPMISALLILFYCLIVLYK